MESGERNGAGAAPAAAPAAIESLGRLLASNAIVRAPASRETKREAECGHPERSRPLTRSTHLAKVKLRIQATLDFLTLESRLRFLWSCTMEHTGCTTGVVRVMRMREAAHTAAGDARAAKAAARARPRTRKLIDDHRAVVEAPAVGD